MTKTVELNEDQLAQLKWALNLAYGEVDNADDAEELISLALHLGIELGD
jgi:TRAP-type uncharacterized transport system substrate-binding protein